MILSHRANNPTGVSLSVKENQKIGQVLPDYSELFCAASPAKWFTCSLPVTSTFDEIFLPPTDFFNFLYQ
jgi:hypothetical protein